MDKWIAGIASIRSLVTVEGGEILDKWAADTAGLIKSGTMRKWMEAHDGQRVDTLQIHLMGEPRAWAPTNREVSAKRATYVELNGSIRDYKGAVVLGASDDVLVVATGSHVIAYRVTR